MCLPVVCGGGLLEEMCGDASRVATAMFAFRVVMLLATVGRDVVFHADQPVVMVVMRNNRHHQHDYADEYQKKCDIPFIPHLPSPFGWAKIEV